MVEQNITEETDRSSMQLVEQNITEETDRSSMQLFEHNRNTFGFATHPQLCKCEKLLVQYVSISTVVEQVSHGGEFTVGQRKCKIVQTPGELSAGNKRSTINR